MSFQRRVQFEFEERQGAGEFASLALGDAILAALGHLDPQDAANQVADLSREHLQAVLAAVVYERAYDPELKLGANGNVSGTAWASSFADAYELTALERGLGDDSTPSEPDA